MALQYCLVLEYFTHHQYPPWIHHWMLTDALPILHERMQTCTVKTLVRLSQLQQSHQGMLYTKEVFFAKEKLLQA